MDEQKMLIESAGIALMVVEEDTTIAMVNPEFERLTGYRRQDVEEAASWTEFIAQNDLNKVTEFYRRRMVDPTHAPYNCEAGLLVKGGEIREVVLSIEKIPETKRSILSILDVTGWKMTEERLLYMATRDILTGLPNRTVFTDRLTVSLAQARRNRKKFAVMLLDLDRFKEINDSLGHNFGDEVLRVVGLRLQKIVRKSDTVARMGGDEFLFLFPDISQADSTAVIADKLLGVFREPISIQRRTLTLTASLGISIFPDDGDNGDTLMRTADIAMYQAKRMGGDRYQRYGPRGEAGHFRVLLIEHDVNHADYLQSMLSLMEDPRLSVDWVSRLSIALEHLPQERTDLIISDLYLPDSAGLETAERILKEAPDIPLVVIVNNHDAHLGHSALGAGAQDYLVKGQIDDVLLRRSIRYAIERHRLQQELDKERSAGARAEDSAVRELLQAMPDGVLVVDDNARVVFANRAAEILLDKETGQLLDTAFEYPLDSTEALMIDVVLPEGTRRIVEMRLTTTTWKGTPAVIALLRDMTDLRMADDEEEPRHLRWREAVEKVIHALASSVGGKDLYMTHHQSRVTALSCAIAEEMALPEDQIEGLKLAAMIHDIGKLYTPGEILSKPADLTDLEFDLVKMHPVIGYEIFKDLELPWPVAQTIAQHHERLDGSGYPEGLSGDEILLEARIMAVADVMESLLSPRSYRPARTMEDALSEIVSQAGTLYDPDVAQACLRLFQEKGFTFDQETQSSHLSLDR